MGKILGIDETYLWVGGALIAGAFILSRLGPIGDIQEWGLYGKPGKSYASQVCVDGQCWEGDNIGVQCQNGVCTETEGGSSMTQTNNDGSTMTSTDPQVAQDMIDQINRRIRRQQRQIFDDAQGNAAYAYQGAADIAGAQGMGGGAGGANGLGQINNDFMQELQAMIRQAVAEGMQGGGDGLDVNGMPGQNANGMPGHARGGHGGIGGAGGAGGFGGHGGIGRGGGMRRKKRGMGMGAGKKKAGGKTKAAAPAPTAPAVDCTDPANAQAPECTTAPAETSYAYAYPGYGYGQEFYAYATKAAKGGGGKSSGGAADSGGSDTAATDTAAATPEPTCMTPDQKPCTCDTPAPAADTAGDTESSGSGGASGGGSKSKSKSKKSKKSAFGYAYYGDCGEPDAYAYNTGNTFELNMPTNPMSSSVYSNVPYHQMTPFKVVTA